MWAVPRGRSASRTVERACNDAAMPDDRLRRPDDRRHRVVVGATGQDEAARRRARALLMTGREVVFVGGGQNIEQLARTVQAEDAGEVMIDASSEERTALLAALTGLGLAGRIRVTGV